MEKWKDVVGYEGLYKVSSYGRIMKATGKEIAQRRDKDGYLIVTLYKNKIRKDYKVHRLVGIAFIENPNNYPMINHKDESKDNNCVSNLEWCTARYNNNYGSRNSKISKKQKGVPHPKTQGCRNFFYGKHYTGGLHPQAKKVVQMDDSGNIIAVFDCTVSAAKAVGCNQTAISMCCLGKRKRIKGYIWKYL